MSYELWLAHNHEVTNLAAHKNNYEVICRELANSFRDCQFWKEVLNQLRELDGGYSVKHKFPLIATFEPEIVTKPWSSFLDKSYRKNILQNTRFPDPPEDGWGVPPQWYSMIHDIVRTTIIVKYIDGVPLVIGTLTAIAEKEKLKYDSVFETREDGYYGAHFNLKSSREIHTMAWSKEIRVVEFEIQVTTQIKDVIKRLLHTYYESHRSTGKKATLSEIAWNYREDEFVATYLGHILYYVEGMIIEIRDRRRPGNA